VDPNDEMPELDIKMRDIYPIDNADGGDQRLPITWQLLREELENARPELAVFRCCDMLIELKKRTDAIKDPDCIAE
jgi:hypothetical protein